jgi:hypothetical protein
MKKTINYLAIASCFTLGASLAHADPWGPSGTMHDGMMQGGAMYGGMMFDGPMYGYMESRMFKDVDTNGDGSISRAEFDAFHAKRFKEMDANGDGKITLDEMKAEHKKILEKARNDRFDAMDTNHDGKVTREEMNAAMDKWSRDRDDKK